MGERRPWTELEDSLLRKMAEENSHKADDKMKWGDIADVMNREGNIRTGKQCRQRWHNQLKPGIDNDRQWSEREEQILFRVQEEVGNHWAQIAKQLPGRTDNNIKNYFYSTLRKALRKVNNYVTLHKKNPLYRNVKQFKQQTLSKILSVAVKKYQNKLNLKKNDVQKDARFIKNILVEIQRENLQPTQKYNLKFEDTIENILEFNRNCKRRKGKKKGSEEPQNLKSQQQLEEQEYLELSQKEIKNKNETMSKDKKYQRSSKTTLQNKQQILQSNNLSDLLLQQKSSSSRLRSMSSGVNSSFQKYQKQQDSQQQFNPFKTQDVNQNNNSFLSRLPNLEKRITNKNQLDMSYWREEDNTEKMNFLEVSHNFRPPHYNEMLNKSLSLNNSEFLQKRASSRLLQKKNSQK